MVSKIFIDSYIFYNNNKESGVSQKVLRLYLNDWKLNYLSDKNGLQEFVNRVEKQDNSVCVIPEQEYKDELG